MKDLAKHDFSVLKWPVGQPERIQDGIEGGGLQTVSTHNACHVLRARRDEVCWWVSKAAQKVRGFFWQGFSFLFFSSCERLEHACPLRRKRLRRSVFAFTQKDKNKISSSSYFVLLHLSSTCFNPPESSLALVCLVVCTPHRSRRSQEEYAQLQEQHLVS